MSKKIQYAIFVGGVFLLGGVFWWWNNHQQRLVSQKDFEVSYQGRMFEKFSSTKKTVREALEENGFEVDDSSVVWPSEDGDLQAGMKIQIIPSVKMVVRVDGEEKNIQVAARDLREALSVAGVSLREEDIVTPSLEESVWGGMEITVVRVTVTEETEEEKIPFKKVEEEDATLSWQTKKIAQKGELGIKKRTYEVSRHNDTVVQKKLIAEEIVKGPVDEKTVIGTKVTVVKKHSGGASWYAHTGTLAAANPWLPFGSYVRVTNKANGKSVIVKINDRGPFGAGRIIDLDKVAFAKIADLGTGVIDVLMEEIK